MRRTLLIIASILFGFAAQAQIITTVAGGGTSGLGDGGLAINCELNNPIGIAVDAVGNIYIGDRDKNRIRKINTSGIIITIAGTGTAGFSGDGGPATDAELFGPYGLCVDASGNVYFTDNGNDRIRKISTAGIITTTAGGGAGGLGDGGPATDAIVSPGGVVIDASGNLYIADGINHRVRKVSTSGIITTIAGGGSVLGDGGPATAAKMNLPYSIVLDVSGSIFVSEDYGARVRKISTSGIISTVAGTGVSGYSGDGAAATNAALDRPVGLAVDWQGNIYIGQAGSHVVRKVNTSGIISTIAGTGTAGYSGDGGAALSAQLSSPTGLAIGTGGSLLIADFANDRIRSVSNVVAVSDINEREIGLAVYPNPSRGDFTVNVSLPLSEDYTLTITDMAGRMITQQKGPSNKGMPIYFNAPNGVYLLYVTSSQGSISQKISILK